MGIIIGLLLFGLALIVGPIAGSVLGANLGSLTTVLMIGSGIVLVLLSTTLLVITRLYVKTKADEVFVRTGWGGHRIIKDGGAVVIPVVHTIVPISLKTFKLEVKRAGKDALLTKDKLRADISGEFFVRVNATDDGITAAARCFGDKMLQPGYVASLVEDKLVSALRSVAATKDLEELNSDRESFIENVKANIVQDLTENGLILETATMSQLDQTDQQFLKEGNIFDAQGLRTIAEITQKQLTEKNELVRAGERARTQQDVETRKQVLSLEQDKARAEAEQTAQIAKIKAQQEQEAKQKEIEALREVEVSELTRQRAVEVAGQEKQAAIINAQREVEVTERAKQQAVEVAERAKQKAIAEAQQEQTAAEAELAKQEALREAERQQIKTVEVTAAAERSKQQMIITAQADAEKKYLEAQRAADAKAYETEKEAQGRKAAADADAEAVTKKAKADADAKIMAAEAERAKAMVPVDVESKRVDVEQRRVDVLQQELAARQQHGQVAQDFELAKLQITMDAEVRKSQAEAMAKFGAKFETQLYGTPEDVANMTQKLFSGMALANQVNGFLHQADEAAKQALEGAAGKVGDLIGAAAKRLGGTAAGTGNGTAETDEE